MSHLDMPCIARRFSFQSITILTTVALMLITEWPLIGYTIVKRINSIPDYGLISEMGGAF